MLAQQQTVLEAFGCRGECHIEGGQCEVCGGGEDGRTVEQWAKGALTTGAAGGCRVLEAVGARSCTAALVPRGVHLREHAGPGVLLPFPCTLGESQVRPVCQAWWCEHSRLPLSAAHVMSLNVDLGRDAQ